MIDPIMQDWLLEIIATGKVYIESHHKGRYQRDKIHIVSPLALMVATGIPLVGIGTSLAWASCGSTRFYKGRIINE